MSETQSMDHMIHSYEEIGMILFIMFLSYLLESFKIQFNISIINIFLFINLIGLYYLCKKIKINIRIEYN